MILVSSLKQSRNNYSWLFNLRVSFKIKTKVLISLIKIFFFKKIQLKVKKKQKIKFSVKKVIKMISHKNLKMVLKKSKKMP